MTDDPVLATGLFKRVSGVGYYTKSGKVVSWTSGEGLFFRANLDLEEKWRLTVYLPSREDPGREAFLMALWETVCRGGYKLTPQPVSSYLAERSATDVVRAQRPDGDTFWVILYDDSAFITTKDWNK